MPMNTNHPTSPHLQIYKLPLTGMLSITHRMTGAVLSIGALLMVLFLVAVASGPESYAATQTHLTAWYGQLFLLLFTFALYFHFCNGIRHLIWDVGWGFELGSVQKSAFATIAAAVALTLMTWLVALIVR